jgi:putative nucleotidyltransferase with HDIG domain
MADVRLVELLAALSVATDLGMAQAPEKAIRSCLVATRLAVELGLPDRDVRDVHLTTLMRHLGCTATAADEAFHFGGDELASRPASERTDFGSPREMIALTLSTGRGTGVRRPRHLARALAAGGEGTRILTAVCEVGAAFAQRLGLGPVVRDSLYQVMERWDGKGLPQRLSGDDIAMPARVSDVATQVVIADREGGADAAFAMVARRAGGWFDPSVVDAFGRCGADVLAELAVVDPWEAVLDAEPPPYRLVAAPDLDRVAATFADFADLKSPYLAGHSSEVAALAEAAASSLGLPDDDVADLRRAALLHDLGRTAISNGVWDKAGALTRSDWEQVRLHAYHTERILAGAPALAPLVPIAGGHHERLDGSGYHRGASASQLPLAAFVLAAADAYQAMTQDRPHRPARAPDAAASVLSEEAAAGRLHPDCVRAVVEAAGRPAPTVRGGWPADLTDREVEVLGLLARGRSNREIAEALVVSRRTAEHHVQHIYAKLGTSTRAAAAVFAMEHGLLR